MDRDSLIAISKSVLATAVLFIVVYFVTELINKLLLGDIVITVTDVLYLTRPEISFTISAVLVALIVYMFFTLRE